MNQHRMNKAQMDLAVQKAAAQTKEHKCSCGCIVFQKGIVLKFVSGLVIGLSKTIAVEQMILYCTSCLKPVTSNPDGSPEGEKNAIQN